MLGNPTTHHNGTAIGWPAPEPHTAPFRMHETRINPSHSLTQQLEQQLNMYAAWLEALPFRRSTRAAASIELRNPEAGLDSSLVGVGVSVGRPTPVSPPIFLTVTCDEYNTMQCD